MAKVFRKHAYKINLTLLCAVLSRYIEARLYMFTCLVLFSRMAISFLLTRYLMDWITMLLYYCTKTLDFMCAFTVHIESYILLGWQEGEDMFIYT